MLAGREAHAPLRSVERLEEKIAGLQLRTSANIGESCLACVRVADHRKQGHRGVLRHLLVLEVVVLDLQGFELLFQFRLTLT